MSTGTAAGRTANRYLLVSSESALHHGPAGAACPASLRGLPATLERPRTGGRLAEAAATGFGPLPVAAVSAVSATPRSAVPSAAGTCPDRRISSPARPASVPWPGLWLPPLAAARNADATARGTVKFFNPENGYGAIAPAGLPGGLVVRVRFSVIEMGGYRVLNAGDEVESDYELARQDSFRFLVTRVRTA